jgi:hypothetical protein
VLVGRRKGGKTPAQIKKAIHNAVWKYLGRKRFSGISLPNKEAEDETGMPDVLAEFYKYKRWDWQHLPWPGAMSDQPWQWMFEMDCVAEAIELQEALDRQAEKQLAELQQTNALPGRLVN